MSQFPRSPQLPPRIPPDVEDISRAVCLLGNRIASDLKDKTKSELISLIGTYPTQEQAKYWKQALKRMLKEEAELAPPPPQKPVFLSPERSPEKKPFSNKPKRLKKQPISKQPASKIQQWHKRQLASNEYLHPGVSNLAGIDLDLLRDEDDWEADFGF